METLASLFTIASNIAVIGFACAYMVGAMTGAVAVVACLAVSFAAGLFHYACCEFARPANKAHA